MSRQLDRYRNRYIQAIRAEMATRHILHYRDIAPKVNSTDKTLSAIMSERQYPTVQHGIDLCMRLGYSANWLFLGKGEARLNDQATLQKILKLVQKL